MSLTTSTRRRYQSPIKATNTKILTQPGPDAKFTGDAGFLTRAEIRLTRKERGSEGKGEKERNVAMLDISSEVQEQGA